MDTEDETAGDALGFVEGEHYYFDEHGRWVYTEKYHLMRGYCCGSGCIHCPYQNNQKTVPDPEDKRP